MDTKLKQLRKLVTNLPPGVVTFWSSSNKFKFKVLIVGFIENIFWEFHRQLLAVALQNRYFLRFFKIRGIPVHTFSSEFEEDFSHRTLPGDCLNFCTILHNMWCDNSLFSLLKFSRLCRNCIHRYSFFTCFKTVLNFSFDWL